jgi:hypothetical protein
VESTGSFIDVALSWSRADAGNSAVLKRGAGDFGWTDIGRTERAEFAAQGLHAQRPTRWLRLPSSTPKGPRT